MGFKKQWMVVCIGFVLAITSMMSSAQEPSLYIYSTVDALLAGAYDGDLTIAQLSKKGNFGLGTYNHLDGEMVALNGVYYHVRANGKISVADPSEQVPFAYVLPFQPTKTFTAKSLSSLQAIEALTDYFAANKNWFYAIEVKGEFSGVSTRAVSPQTRPYKPLAEVSKSQVVFRQRSVAGTLVGIRSPSFSKGISVPGYHWHFISDDRQFGGHVLAAALVKGVVKLASVHAFEVELPVTDDFANSDQSKDRAAELHQVETMRR